jgi:hypothetical protein
VRSWDALPISGLKPAGAVSNAFLKLGMGDYRSAARHVNGIPYGRNRSRTEVLAVLSEGRGTCSTKHALLKQLALEQGLDVALMIGIYEMSERNTPGVGQVLSAFGLEYVPEAHCYLRYEGQRIDVTRSLEGIAAEPIGRFLHEEEIVPAQIGEYKVELHQQFMRRWIRENPKAAGHRDFESVWRIREECIAALSAF